MYQTEVLTEKYFKIFMGAYNDFRVNCAKLYRFELEPLNYDDFLEYFNKDIIKCIILLEGAIPTAFLAYSKAQENSIELYVIHCLGDENLNEKKKLLLQAFLDETKEYRKTSLVSYPMLGIQENFKDIAGDFGFKFVNLAVLDFPITDKKETRALEKIRFTELPIGYKIVSYRDVFKEGLRNCIFKAFENTSDINFDPRFKTLKGADDITNKITEEIYGKFLPSSSKILLYENEVVGFCLANITGIHIANIPLVGIVQEHRGLGLSEVMLKLAVEDIIKLNKQGLINVDVLNVSTDYDNTPAVKMYEQMGFKLTYTYPQAYLPESQS
ncbi:MAG: GNAT family N-acetyltransferase [Candidatus Gastranaerophilales bacterium]|nr:GNAT family N-acetyltransferase [Candidatus Gastranaerophilales bacterium]